MSVISQRELRNQNAEVMRGVEEGRTYTVTRRGVPVARIVPLTELSDLRCDRPARRRPTYSDQRRVRTEVTSAEILEDLRGDR
jgi:prevent-host-death family protein